MDVANIEPKTYDIDEEAIFKRHPALRYAHWPLAGLRLTPALREAWGLPSEDEEKARKKAPVEGVRIPNTHHDYSLAGGYFVPYYPSDHETLANRSETRIISRSRAWILNAEPQLNISRTKEQIDFLFHRFAQDSVKVDPADSDAMNEVCAEFRQMFGAIMTRFEQLGRAIEQGNTEGTSIRFPSATEDGSGITALSEDQVETLRNEYKKYWVNLMNPEFMPLLRLVRLTDMKPDYDGVLIDLMREIGKPITTQEVWQEYAQDTNIVAKVGEAMHSIDQVHDIMHKAMTEGKSGELFNTLAKSFIQSSGAQYNLATPDDILQKLDDYAALCRARCGIRANDALGFDTIYPKQSTLEDFFNSASGFLQTVRHQHHALEGPKKKCPTIANLEEELDATKEELTAIRELNAMRTLLTRGVKLMNRTAYTRIPCNATAPEVWIPNFESKDPIEAHMANRLLSAAEQKHAKRAIAAAEMLPEKDREKFLNARLCSVGHLEAGFKELEQTLQATKERSTSR